MTTFLVRFGYSPRYVLSRDLITFNALYCSAMRCMYLDKSEDVMSMMAAVATCIGGGKKGKTMVDLTLEMWKPAIESRGGSQKESGRSDTDGLSLRDEMAGGFVNLTQNRVGVERGR